MTNLVFFTNILWLPSSGRFFSSFLSAPDEETYAEKALLVVALSFFVFVALWRLSTVYDSRILISTGYGNSYVSLDSTYATLPQTHS
jgi:hypothetical protein